MENPDELFGQAIELIKAGDIIKARERLKLPSGAVTDDEFVNAMIALQQAILLCSQGAQAEALPYLQTALPVVDKSEDEAVKFQLHLIAKTAEGISRILMNDPRGALPLFEEVAKVAQKMAFYDSTTEKYALTYQAMGYLAAMRASLNVGDLQAAENCFGSARELYRKILGLLDLGNEADRVGFLEAYGTQLEGATSFAIADLQALDVVTAEKRIAGSAEDAAGLQRVLGAMAPGPFKNLGEMILRFHHAVMHIAALEKAVIFDRSPAERSRIEEFKRLERELYEVSQFALGAGQRGQTYVAFARILDRQRQNLLALDSRKVSTVDKQRAGRIATFISFIVIVIVVQFTIHPEGIIAAFLFIGEIVISLIVGFGYGAIRFQGMVGQYAALLPKAGGGKGEAAAAAPVEV